MDHVAIMKKSWGFTEKILSGEKTIESRWYATRRKPWNVIVEGDTVYFKNSGEPITISAVVWRVLQFEYLTPRNVREILAKYGADDGIEKKEIPEFFARFKDKKYCILIFLKSVHKVWPFDVDKTGFGAMSAWIAVPDISKIKE